MSYLIQDKINLLSKITFIRFWNAVKIISSYYLSKWTTHNLHCGSPISVSVEPTTSCNLGCPECPSGLREFTRPTGMLDEKFFRKVIDDLHKELMYMIFYFQGEPYLNPKFLDFVKYASEKNIYTATSTNAHYLNNENARKTVDSGLNRLIISIDGTTQETYEMYRVRGNLDKVIEGTKNVIKWKKELKSKTPHTIFQFLVVRHNEHQIEEIKELGKTIGVDEVRFKTAQVYDYTHGNNLIPEKEEYSRYQKLNDGTFTIKNNLLNHCWRLWHSCVITWDGLLVPCCFDKDAQNRLGDLKTESFKKLWRGSLYNDFRSSVLRSRSEIEICKNCTEGTKVWA